MNDWILMAILWGLAGIAGVVVYFNHKAKSRNKGIKEQAVVH